jgi:hypothetical protein
MKGIYILKMLCCTTIFLGSSILFTTLAGHNSLTLFLLGGLMYYSFQWFVPVAKQVHHMMMKVCEE